jgi:hypothetical protein
MELKTFKKTVNDTLIRNGLKKKGNYYHYDNGDLIFVVGLQRSNYSNLYYINLGIIIKILNSSLGSLRDIDGDIRARFSFKETGKKIDSFDLDYLLENDCDKLERLIQDNIDIYINPIASVEKLKLLLEDKPIMLLQTNLRAKHFLGFE